MKILVAVKRVLAPDQRIRLWAGRPQIDDSDLSYAVNPFDAELGINWPIPIDREDRSLLSAKDAAAPALAEVLARS